MTVRYYKPEEVKRILNIENIETVYRWLRSGRLRGVKVSDKMWRISSTALDSFLGESGADYDVDSK